MDFNKDIISLNKDINFNKEANLDRPSLTIRIGRQLINLLVFTFKIFI